MAKPWNLKRIAPGKLCPRRLCRDSSRSSLTTSIAARRLRRLLVEQTIKREPVTAAAAVARELSWMAKPVPALIGELQNEGHRAGTRRRRADRRAAPSSGPNTPTKLPSTFALRRQRLARPTPSIWPSPAAPPARWQHVESASASSRLLPTVHPRCLEWPRPHRHARSPRRRSPTCSPRPRYPLEFWEYELLPPRVPDFAPAACSTASARTGHRVWVGMPPPAQSDIALAFWPRACSRHLPAPCPSQQVNRHRPFHPRPSSPFEQHLHIPAHPSSSTY